MWTKRASGKISSSRPDAGQMGRRLQDDPLLLAERQPLQKPDQRLLPAAAVGGRERLQIEILRILRRLVGKDHRQVWRRDSHVAQREFFLLRPLPAGDHVVHRPPRRQQEPQAGDHKSADQEMIRREALIRSGERVALVEHHHLVQQRRSAAPMPDDENRRILDLHLGQLAPKIASCSGRRVELSSVAPVSVQARGSWMG